MSPLRTSESRLFAGWSVSSTGITAPPSKTTFSVTAARFASSRRQLRRHQRNMVHLPASARLLSRTVMRARRNQRHIIPCRIHETAAAIAASHPEGQTALAKALLRAGKMRTARIFAAAFGNPVEPDVSVMETRRCVARATAYAAVLLLAIPQRRLTRKIRFRLPVSAQNAALTSAPAPPATSGATAELTGETRAALHQRKPCQQSARLIPGAQQDTVPSRTPCAAKPARQRINTLTGRASLALHRSGAERAPDCDSLTPVAAASRECRQQSFQLSSHFRQGNALPPGPRANLCRHQIQGIGPGSVPGVNRAAIRASCVRPRLDSIELMTAVSPNMGGSDLLTHFINDPVSVV